MRISICPDSNSPYIVSLTKAIRKRGVDVDLIPWFGKQTPYSAIKLMQSKMNGSQLVHFHWVPFNWELSRRLGKWLGDRTHLKAVWTIHNLDYHSSQFGSTTKDHEQMIAMAVWASAGIVHCDRTGADFKQRYGSDLDLFTIPHGNFLEYVQYPDRQISRKMYGLSENDVGILLFSPNRWSKGIVEFVEILESLPDNYIGILAGHVKQPDILSYLKKTQQRLPKKIRVDTSQFSRERMAHVFAASDLFLIPYEGITTSGTIMDAISYGKAVISRDIGNVYQLVEDGYNGYLCQEKTEMWKRIQTLDHEKLLRMGRASVEMAKRYDWDAIAKETIKVYDMVI